MSLEVKAPENDAVEPKPHLEYRGIVKAFLGVCMGIWAKLSRFSFFIPWYSRGKTSTSVSQL